MIGELPLSANYRGYWKLQNTDDSSGNGRDLFDTSAAGTVSFNAGKFGFAADYGTSGTKCLGRPLNPLSALKVPNMTFSLWFKLGTTASSSSPASDFVVLSTITDGTTDGCYSFTGYVISAGPSMEIRYRVRLSVTDAFSTYTIVPDLNWHHLAFVKEGTTTNRIHFDGRQVATNTGSGIDNSATDTPADCLSIGNSRDTGKLQQMLGQIDELIIEERAWSASEIRRYYSQGRGFLV